VRRVDTPYFLVLPVFVLAMLVLSISTVVCATVPRLRPALPFLWRVLVWSGAGCIVANLPVLALYTVPYLLERRGFVSEPGNAGNVLRVVLAAGLLIGPFVASAAGFVGGAAFGVWRASRKPRATNIGGTPRLKAGTAS
jgi:MFS family permease